MSLAVNRCTIQPITSAGVLATPGSESAFSTGGRGVYRLAAGTHYFPLPVGGATMFNVHLQHDAEIAAVGTIETCGFAESEVADHSTVAGEWMDQDPSTAFVATVGATTTAASGVATIVAGNLGGADWQISLCSAPRARLKLVVTTAGEVRVGFTGKN